MPIYEYSCEDCRREFQSLRKMSQADSAEACEHCGSRNTKRKLSVFFAQSGGQPVAGTAGKSCGGCSGGSCGSCSH